MSWIESFLVNFALAILDKYLGRAVDAIKEQSKIDELYKKAESYQKIIQDKTLDREARRAAEDDLLS